MPLDSTDTARLASTTVDKNGQIVAVLDDYGSPVSGCPVWQQLGIRARPRAGATIDCLASGNGDGREVTALHDPAAVKALGDVATGEIQIYSPSTTPFKISIKDAGVLLGGAATKAAAREGDEVDCGTLTITFTPPATLAGTYQSPFDVAPVPWVPGGLIRLRGKIKNTGAKTKIE